MCSVTVAQPPFSLVLVDESRNQEFPCGDFWESGPALEARDKLNAGRAPGQERYVVRDESGDPLYA